MAVSVIADYGSMVKPQNTLQTERSAKFLLDLLLTEIFVAVY